MSSLLIQSSVFAERLFLRGGLFFVFALFITSPFTRSHRSSLLAVDFRQGGAAREVILIQPIPVDAEVCDLTGGDD